MKKQDTLQEDIDRPSKSQRKREVEALQVLGEQLATLPEQALRSLSLDDRLLEALLAVRHISQRGARKRQVQYVGKLMRQVDEPELVAMENLLHAANIRRKPAGV